MCTDTHRVTHKQHLITEYIDSLDMNVVASSHYEDIGYEIILHSGVDLDNVASLAPHVKVVDRHILKIFGALTDSKCMRSVAK